jgi:hypothetical protein
VRISDTRRPDPSEPIMVLAQAKLDLGYQTQ